jgi:signal transduction histidine kinase
MKERSDNLSARLKAAEEQFEISQRRIRTLIDALPLGLLIAGGSGLVEAANPHSLALFNCDYSYFTDRKIAHLFAKEFRKIFSLNITNEENAQPKEVIAIRADDSQFPAEVVIRSFASQSEPKLLVLVEDVTIRHEVEKMKQEFVSMISHDLRTPLSSIQFFLANVADGRYDRNPDVMKDRARSTEADATRLINMINRLLQVDKLEAGQLQMVYNVVNCRELVEGAVQSVQSLAEEKHIAIEVLDKSENIYVMADAEYIVQVLVNLLSNSLKFSPPNQKVTVKTETNEQFVKLMVVDHGRGIAPADREKIFDRFKQVSIEDERVKGGTGLGLSISKAIVEQHKGNIGVESELGAGSTFWFTLPKLAL